MPEHCCDSCQRLFAQFMQDVENIETGDNTEDYGNKQQQQQQREKLDASHPVWPATQIEANV